MEEQADKALAFPNAFGLTVRYAMKANPNQSILGIFDRKGIHIDASSSYEVRRAIEADIPHKNILLTSQEIPRDFVELIKRGIEYTACSLHQLENYGATFPDRGVSVRINPGLGSGGTNKTNTGGPSSSFGIWHEQIDEVLAIAEKFNSKISRIHTHIGSGSDPKVWKKVALMSLDTVLKFVEAGHDIKTLNLGGGYKVGRMSYEESTDLQECGEPVKEAFVDFAKKTGIELKLEIEPGTFLIANAGCLIAKAIDIKTTPDYNFAVINSGMTEVARPTLYGAQHPISVIPKDVNATFVDIPMVISGHCCESGDILTTEEEKPGILGPRELLAPSIGDLVVIGGTGAYCSSMSCKNYNSYPEAAEVLIDNKGELHLIKKRQTFEQLIQNEV